MDEREEPPTAGDEVPPLAFGAGDAGAIEGEHAPESTLVEAELAVEKSGRKALHEIVQLWIPLTIVLVSVLAAVMGWRASLADESATHTEELSRQDLVHQQLLRIQDYDSVDNDLRTYGDFAQYSALAHSLLHDAGSVGGQAGEQLVTEGQADLGIARYLGKQLNPLLGYAFDPSNPTSNPNLRSDGTLAPNHAYNAALALQVAENSNVELHGLEPEKLHEQAEAERTTGLRLTGIAALFVSVIVLLTIAALVRGYTKLWLTAPALALTIAGIVLFILVEAT
jgi:hypothetical protein